METPGMEKALRRAPLLRHSTRLFPAAAVGNRRCICHF